MDNNKTKIIVTGVTFVLFTLEGLIHWNLAHYYDTKDKKDYKFTIPPFQETLKLVTVVAAFSLVGGFVVGALTKK